MNAAPRKLSKKARPLRGLLSLLLLLGVAASFGGCEQINDTVRNWGERSRRNRAKELREEELKKWERDLNLSRARTLELHKTVHEIVQESNRQGMLAWKIARAYMADQRFEMAAQYYQGAAGGDLPDPRAESALFESALPFYREALRRRKLNEELLFETGLCYANASRALGWEPERWRTAVFMFEQMRAVKPEDSRADYQLALLYGKTTNENLRNRERAIELLTDLIRREEHNLPAHFARAHIMTEKGDLAGALQAYNQLREQMEVLHEKGVIGGNLKNNPQYRRLSVNIEKLEVCVNNLPGCEISGD